MKRKGLKAISLVALIGAMIFNISIKNTDIQAKCLMDDVKSTALGELEGFGPDINAPLEKVCHPRKTKCTWRAISDRRSCTSDLDCM